MKSMFSVLPLQVIVLFALWVTPCHAADKPLPPVTAVDKSVQGDDIPMLDTKTEAEIDKKQEEYSKLLLETAEWIDSFFDDNRYLEDTNKTRGVVKLGLGYSRKDDFEIKPRFDIRLSLPRLENKVAITFQGSDDADFDIDNNPLLQENAEDRDPSAGVSYYWIDTERWNFSWDGGVSWNYVYGGARIRYQHPIGDTWQGRFTNRVRYYSDDGWQNIAAYDLETRVKQDLFFRATTNASIYEKDDGLFHGQNFRIFKVLNEYSIVSMDTGIFLRTEPSYRMQDLQLKVRYRQRFFRDWLVLEISPRCSWPDDYDYRFNPGIMVQLEATFGYKTDASVYRKIFNP